jgi:hypothetical protein
MKRIAATALLAMGMLARSEAAPDTTQTAQAAAEQARAEAARQLHAQASEFTVVTIEPAQWSDSSLGCRKPDAMYQEVMSSGYVVVLEREGQRHQVNVVGSRAVMCEANTRLSGTVRQPLGAHGLDREQAEQRARAKLAEHLKIAPDAITVTRSEPQTWSDSSMGCGKPGSVALTVITEGYAVVLSAQGSTHNVHVSGSSAVICNQGAMLHRDGRAMNARGLDSMMERARQDLAQRLGADPAKIRLAGQQPYRWDDSGLGCPRQGEALKAGPVDGFKLALKYLGRTYTYHTDRQDVRPCPAIEAE